MPHIKRRLIAGILGLTIAVTLAACDSSDPSDPNDGGTDTTEPVGS